VTAPQPTTVVTVLTQQNCASCERAKQVLDRVATAYPLSTHEVSLDTPPGRELALKHGVMFALLDGALFSYGRLSERKLRRTLTRRGG